ncbi:DNA helicase-2 / ATP-dependent DNA helicase PcrA [Marinospirillum celere]|uniref:DNA 3'-5' helicase n=1 Tax=Marinospirillum celere TaxID=1122252 RepID=A0A1I1F1Z9_9GAMM|nr:ATP-dependent helicase [Marinospirillum celere]SFB91190.1 DNA helicase-2 / ATP-dependent DNA helicase PcrA [Marinospirillum celere]
MSWTALTEEQLAVVKHQEGHARVRAVAGSGKTTTLVERVIHLLNQGVPARRLLVVMYNRSAREDFTRKLQIRAGQAGLRVSLPDVRTFHSLGHRLTASLVRWGYLETRRLQQEEWVEDSFSRQAIKKLAETQGEDAQPWLEEDMLEAFKSFCTLVKSGLQPAIEVAENLELAASQKHFAAAFDEREKLLAEQQVMFFDDLLWRPLQVLDQHPEIRSKISGFLDYLVVDEYQDINEVQQALLVALAGQAQVMVVGDVDQCIYEWRGARPDYMLHRFQQDFPGVREYPLSRSFRFGHSLALAANQVIQHNSERPPQLTLAVEPQSTQLAQGQGAGWLLKQLQAWQLKHPEGKASVLVRSWSQSLAVQLAFLKAHQPFQLARQEHFLFNRPQIKGLLAYARLALNGAPGRRINFQHPAAQADFYQLLSFPTLYLTEPERQALVQARVRGKATLDASLDQLPPGKRQRLQKRLQLLNKLAAKAGKMKPLTFLDWVLNATDALEQLKKTAASKESGDEALRLIEGLRRYAGQSQATLGRWIEELEIAQQEGAASLANQQASQVSIQTIHAAKGLEWDWVGVYGLNEGDFPYTSGFSRLTAAQEEAERRLFYVAITRARQELVLAEGETAGPASRFLQEASIRDALYWAEALADPVAATESQQVAYPDLLAQYWQAVTDRPQPEIKARVQAPKARQPLKVEEGELKVGDRVVHQQFGEGLLLRVEGDFPHRLLDISFDQQGLKRMKEEIAQIRPLQGA